MASLRSITQNNPDSIVYDERTKQYHDTANRYRMVKKSVAEAMRATVSSGAPTRGNENFVSQAVFDAFRKDISKHVSETARLTKIGLEELKKSFDYQSKETERLQRAVNRTDEESQEQNKIEKISDTAESQERKRERRRNRRGMSMSSFLGLSAGGLLGTFLLASMILTPDQHQRIGESIDQSLGAMRTMIDSIRRINDLIQPIVNLIQGIREAVNNPEAPGGLGSTAGSHAGGAGHEGMGLEPEPGGNPAPAPEASTANNAIAIGPTVTRTLDALRSGISYAPSAAPQSPPESENSSQIGAGARANALGQPPGTPIRIEENRDDPSFPHRAISSILLSEEENRTINNMRTNPNIPQSQFQNAVIDMLSRRLQGQDVNTLAERIAATIGSSPSIHNSAEVARNIVRSINNGDNATGAARRLYEIFYQRDVTGGSPIQQRSETLRNRLNRFNEQRQTSANPMGVNRVQQAAATFPAAGNNRVITAVPPIEMGTGRQPGGRFPGSPEPGGVNRAGIQPRPRDPSMDMLASLMGAQAMGSA